MKVYGMNINKKVSVMILFIFILSSSIVMADENSDAFAQVFRNARSGGSNIIERTVDAIYYGLLIMYRGVSVKVSRLCGFILLAFMVIEILQTILKNMSSIDIYAIFRMIIPKFTKNLIIAFMLVMPVQYPMRIAMGQGAPAGNVRGTMVTMITEMVFSMFFKLGLIFFNNPAVSSLSPGGIANVFFSRPLNILKDMFSLMTFFAIFVNIAKIILLLLCLWLSGKIIAVYIANIFMALILTTFSVFYLLFLTMESTVQIGEKGIRTIVVQSVTLFMTVAMMGISYQVINLVVTTKSIQGIAALAIILLMLSQVMENVGLMAQSITSGGGIGNVNAGAFTGLSQAAQSVMAGLVMFGGAKYDEMFGRGNEDRNKGKEGNDMKSLLERARHNVGRPDTGTDDVKAKLGNVLSYIKGSGTKASMSSADSKMNRYRKFRPGIGTSSARLFSALTGGMTRGIDSFDDLKGMKKNFENVFGSREEQEQFRKSLQEAYGLNPSQEQIEEFRRNYPYSSEYLYKQKKVAVNKLERAWNTTVSKLSEPNLNGASGSEAVRQARLNESENVRKPKERVVDKPK